MKSKTMLTFIALVSCGCSYSDLLKEGYINIGESNTKMEAENAALLYIRDNYKLWNEGRFYKVSYSFRETNAQLGQNHAMWYNKTSKQIGLEIDRNSGMMCTWFDADSAILNNAVTIRRGLVSIDSLSQKRVDNSSCLKY